MAIVIRDPGLGEKLGTGIGEGLKMLAENRLGRLQQQEALAQQQALQQQQYRQQASGLQQLLGLSPEQALQAAYAPKEVLGQFAKQKFAEPSSMAYLQALQPFLGQQQENAPAIQGAQQPATANALNLQPGLNQQQATKLAELQMKRQQADAKAAHQGEVLDLKKSKEVRDFSKPFIEKSHKSKANIRDYTDLINIARSGDLRAGKGQQILDALGLGGFFKNFNTQRADKIIARLAQNIGGAFGSGSRITNYLEQTFQRSLPSLWNTPEGIVAISIMNMGVDKANIARDEIRKELIRKNGGKLPFDIEDQIEELAAPEISKIENDTMRSVDALSSGRTVNSLEDARRQGIKRIRDLETGEIIEL